MKDEIKVGVEFLKQFLAKYGQLTQDQIEQFGYKLFDYLEKRYVNHWYEAKPLKGQAFRCLRLKRSEKYVDPVLDKILNELNVSLNKLGLPNDFTLWIDPGEVSVRFGDQVGYTYTIAKFEHENKQPESDCKSSLIVENSENIFDEKLTAFIRQNSTKVQENDLSFNLNDLQLEDDNELSMNQSNIDSNLFNSNLSAEKRTISPPVLSSPVFNINNNINNNSANINTNINTNTNKQVLKRNNSSNISINLFNTPDLKAINRLSLNDSCYYSSSSSSCASSFGSNYDESMIQYAWFGKNEPSLFETLKQSAQNETTNNFNLSLLNENLDLNNNFTNYLSTANILNNNNNNLNITRFGSDTSSERSDTPNSCATSSSFYVNAASPNNNNYFSSSLGFEKFLDENQIKVENNKIPSANIINTRNLEQKLLDSSSSSSTSTTIFTNSDQKLSSTPKKGSDSEEEIKISAKNKSDGNLSTENNFYNNHNNHIINNNNKKNNINKKSKSQKDESYCGYVESFPYYYKLNRLYNALAVQKMQTEKLRKAGLLNSVNMNNPVAVANALATLTNINTSNTSKSLSSSPNTNLTQSNTPPPNIINSKNKSGYPMSPSNAALSLANHQNKNYKQKSNKYLIEQQQQQLQQQGSNKMSLNFNMNQQVLNQPKQFF